MKPYLFSVLASTMLCCVIAVSSAFAGQWPPGQEALSAPVKPAAPSQGKKLVYSTDLEGLEKTEVAVGPDDPAPLLQPVAEAKPQPPRAEPTPEEKIVEILKDASTPQSKGKGSRPERKTTKSARPGENPKDRQISYNKDTDGFRAHVEAPEWQRAFSDRRSFGVFARNYTNRIHCDGVITDVIYPTTKGLELELKNKGHDLFIQVGPSVPSDITYFPVDLNIVCQGEVFQVNAVVDTQYAGTNMELTLSGAASQDSLKPYESAILQAQGLPHEEQLVKILTRVWGKDYLQYWAAKQHNRSCGFGSPCKLSVSIDTGINGIVAWDFLAPIHAGIPELLARLGQQVTGEIIGIGRVHLREAQRVIILSVKKTGAKR